MGDDGFSLQLRFVTVSLRFSALSRAVTPAATSLSHPLNRLWTGITKILHWKMRTNTLCSKCPPWISLNRACVAVKGKKSGLFLGTCPTGQHVKSHPDRG